MAVYMAVKIDTNYRTNVVITQWQAKYPSNDLQLLPGFIVHNDTVAN